MLYFAQIRSYWIRFELIVWHIVWTSMWYSFWSRVVSAVQIIRSVLLTLPPSISLFKNIQANSFWEFLRFVFLVVFQFVLLADCISFLRSRFCRIRAHFVFMVDYMSAWFMWAAGMRKSQECIFIYPFTACSILFDIECFSNSHIVNKFGFIHFGILFSISHIFKNQCFFWYIFLLMRYTGVYVISIAVFEKCLLSSSIVNSKLQKFCWIFDENTYFSFIISFLRKFRNKDHTNYDGSIKQNYLNSDQFFSAGKCLLHLYICEIRYVHIVHIYGPIRRTYMHINIE